MSARTTLEGLRVRYETQRKRQGMAGSTLASERCALKNLCRAWDATRRVPKSMEMSWMEDYLFGEEGLAEGLEPSTYNKMIGQQRQFVEWCTRRNEIRNDVLDAMVRKSQQRKDYVRLPAVQLNRMIEGADDPWERFVLEFGIYTMGRWSELRICQVKHLNFTTGKIKWWREKTDEWDDLPMMAELDTALRRWMIAYAKNIGRPLQPDDYVIPMRVAGGWHPTWEYQYVPEHTCSESIRRAVKKHAAPLVPGGMEAIKGQGVHLLRRSSARALYDALVAEGHADPIRVVMAMLGHKNAHTTELYLGIVRDRENRDKVLLGASFLTVDKTNVVELRRVSG